MDRLKSEVWVYLFLQHSNYWLILVIGFKYKSLNVRIYCLACEYDTIWNAENLLLQRKVVFSYFFFFPRSLNLSLLNAVVHRNNRCKRIPMANYTFTNKTHVDGNKEHRYQMCDTMNKITHKTWKEIYLNHELERLAWYSISRARPPDRCKWVRFPLVTKYFWFTAKLSQAK